MSTERNGPEQPTTPIPRAPGAPDEEPTQVIEAAPTAPLRTSSAPGTTALPTGGAPLPTGGAPETAPLPTGGSGATALGTATTTQPRVDEAPAGTPGTTTGADPHTPSDTETARPVSRTLRVGTVVWGLIVAIIGAGLVAVAAGARFDLELVLIGLLALAGVALVGGSMAASLRRRR